MTEHEHDYQILIVTSTEKFAESIIQLLNSFVHHHTTVVSTVDEASQQCKVQNFEFVIMNYPVRDHGEVSFASRCARTDTIIPLIMAKPEYQSTLQLNLRDQGVYIMQKPVSAQNFLQAFRWILAMHYRLCTTKKQAKTLEQKMEEIRLVNRAKWALISNLKMSEADAHRYIEKQAMNRCITKTSVAESILQTYE